MRSPRLVPGDDPIDTEHLRRMPLGGGPLERDASDVLAERDGVVVAARASIEAILAQPRTSADRIDPL
jgi:hypothetical protein